MSQGILLLTGSVSLCDQLYSESRSLVEIDLPREMGVGVPQAAVVATMKQGAHKMAQTTAEEEYT